MRSHTVCTNTARLCCASSEQLEVALMDDYSSVIRHVEQCSSLLLGWFSAVEDLGRERLLSDPFISIHISCAVYAKKFSLAMKT